MGFEETIAASNLKVGRSRHLIEFMKVYEYWRSRSFLDLGPQGIYIWKLELVFLKKHWAIFNQILYVSFQVQGNESLMTWCLMTWPRWPPLQYMVKTLQKSSSSEPDDRFPQNLLWIHWGLQPIIVCSNDDPGLTLTYCMARSNLVTGISIGKIKNDGFFRNYWSLWPESC